MCDNLVLICAGCTNTYTYIFGVTHRGVRCAPLEKGVAYIMSGLRDYTIMSLLLDTGLRLSEDSPNFFFQLYPICVTYGVTISKN